MSKISSDNTGIQYIQGRLNFVYEQFIRSAKMIDEGYDEYYAILLTDVIEVREHEELLEFCL